MVRDNMCTFNLGRGVELEHAVPTKGSFECCVSALHRTPVVAGSRRQWWDLNDAVHTVTSHLLTYGLVKYRMNGERQGIERTDVIGEQSNDCNVTLSL